MWEKDRIHVVELVNRQNLCGKMKVNQNHWNFFLDIAETRPELITGRFVGVAGREKGKILWDDVSNKLNALGFGQKTTDEWRRAVTDWKSKVKGKAGKLQQGLRQTGGGEAVHPPLSTIEERLLQIMGRKAVTGDNVLELGVEDVPNLDNNDVQPSHPSVANEREDHIAPRDTSPADGPNPPDRKRRKIQRTALHRKPQSLDKLLSMNEKTLEILSMINNTLTTISQGVLSMADTLNKLTSK